ncbi:hypothetical protein [Pseudoalteromonas luteoviolacea]|uniref:Uncharacterized protein n=1 Tax=Pseudoalteromonas luteoviolacea S4060-1 TaxID=1365257 RepID=A0A167MRG6_9GAMM|nr:hypothetical protein [Pseudoalteromonas luteoviolacea]KZN66840.1 hypothetical protein N478_18575 [Pseudoalteromonas luteoviolacea S4060-1]
MTIKADAQGRLSGRFYIPSNVPVGSKSVRFTGAQGSRGEATYTGSGTIRTQTVRRVNNVLQWRFDPLAQTFTLPELRFIAGVELWFKKIGEKAVRVQIRETDLGLPNDTVIAETSLPVSQLQASGPTLFEFAPVSLNAGQEYAIVVLSDDATHEVAIAELGKFDRNSGWVTSQPYQVGVLLSSSNASTWTPHQNRDLSFRLKAARFTSTESSVELGEINLAEHSDLLAMAVIERPSSETQLHFEFSGAQSGEFNLQESQALRLPNKLNETLKVRAKLAGTATQSPVLFDSVQAALGKVSNDADYVTRAIPCRLGGSLKVSFEAQLPGTAKVDVFIEQQGQWLNIPLKTTQPEGDGWLLCNYEYANLADAQSRVKLVLSGTHVDRPRVRSLRAFSV